MRHARTAAIGIAVLASLGAGAAFWTWWQCQRDWTSWKTFTERFVQEDGRVIDYLSGSRSTSEGQAYAMFFALVADDQKRFDAILKWAENNLSGGSMKRKLPAWLWGQADNGEWRVLDDNPASDADLWMAYSLIEAYRLWGGDDYLELANALLEMTLEQSTDTIPGVGRVLLPAPRGFTPEEGVWRLNPSYVPAFLMARLAKYQPAGPWREIASNHAELLAEHNERGLAPDWLTFRDGEGVIEDPETGWTGSYDAIRTYLWAGLWSDRAPAPDALGGMRDLLMDRQSVPETVDTRSGETSGLGPPGFSWALLPYLHALEAEMLDAEALSEAGVDESRGDDAQYYDYVLLLFGQGWLTDRYKIIDDGQLEPLWSRTCCELFH